MKRNWLWVASLNIAILLVLAALMSQQNISFSPLLSDQKVIDSVLEIKTLGFTNAATSEEEKKKISDAHLSFDKARNSAILKVAQNSNIHDNLRFWSNVCASLAIVISFGVSLCGGLAGSVVSTQPTQEELRRVSRANRRMRSPIIILSALAALVVALGNRLDAYSSEYQQTANNVVNQIEKSDSDAKGALNADELLDAAHRLQTGLLRN